MKKAAILAAVMALVLSLAACGNKDNKTNGAGSNNNGTIGNNSTTGNNGTAGNNGVTGNNGTVGNNGITGNNGTVGSNGITGNNSATGNNSTVGNDLGNAGRSIVNGARSAADDMGRAVEDMFDGNTRAASMSSFEQMLDNARVHDTDGILTDGENSRW